MKNKKDESLSEQLLRYGQLYQNASKEQSNSLFGDDIELNTAGRPTIKPALDWPATERLERERELVGIYLSANPLDPYFMELNYGCNTTIKEFIEMTPEENKTYTFGGMVTGYEEKEARSGGKYGRITLEDYSGSTELMLFKQDFFNFSKYGKLGTQIVVAGEFKPNFKQELRFNINNIKLLEDLKGKLLTGIEVKVTTDNINDTFIGLFTDASKRVSSTLGNLTIEIYDPSINRTVKMLSGLKLPMDKSTVDMLTDMNVEFQFTRLVK